MNEKTLVGYHGTKIENVEQILKNGFKMSKSKDNNLEWLGDGVYFWEDDYYAVQWNIIDIKGHNKEKNINSLKKYAIMKSIIKANKTKIFDISSPEGSIIYQKLKEKLINRLIKEGYENYVDILSKRSCKYWIDLLQKNNFFNEFDIVTAVYKDEKSVENFKDDIILNVQKQICVKNINCIKETEIYDNKERIFSLFSIILKKREERKNEKNKKIIKKS